MAVKRQPRLKHFCEIVKIDFHDRIDTENKVVENVALLGSRSKNGHTYSEVALDQAAGLLEGARVFLNHREATSSGIRPHDARNYVGRVSGVFREGDRVKAAKFHVLNGAHWPLVEVANRDPEAFGFSIEGMAEIKRNKVTAVSEIASVDLVSQPATVSGLFENRSTIMDLSKLTVEELREQCPDLVKELTAQDVSGPGEAASKIVELEKQLAEQTTKLEEAQSKADMARVDALVAEAGVECSDKLREALIGMDDETAREFLKLRSEADDGSDPPKSGGGKQATTEGLKDSLKRAWGNAPVLV